MDQQAAYFHDLERSTKAFLDLHYPSQLGSRPEWSEPWRFSGPMPNRNRRGCYALFDEADHLVYVGLGLGKRGNGKYAKHSLGHRINRIWRTVSEGNYRPSKSYSYVDHLRTIHFQSEEGDYFWLAAALEIYLIQDLKPQRNKTYKNY